MNRFPLNNSPALAAAPEPDPQLLKSIVFISRRKAEELTPPANAAIISIHDVSEGPADLKDGWQGRLNLCFHDTDNPESVLQAFGYHDADKVLAFAELHRASAQVLYVHCSLGVSRSAGAAIALSELLELKCFADNLPVTYQNYRVYNKLVYRRIMLRAHDPNHAALPFQSAFGAYQP